jgi:ferric enterobactin receptor
VKYTIALFLFLLGAFISNGQKSHNQPSTGTITGRILDSVTGGPIPYAVVVLHNAGDNKVVNGATTNDKGLFTIDNIDNGSYKAVIDFIGYRKSTRNSLVISDKNKSISLGDVMLIESGANKVVTVNGQKSII